MNSLYYPEEITVITAGDSIPVDNGESDEWVRTGFALREMNEADYRSTQPDQKNANHYLRNYKSRKTS